MNDNSKTVEADDTLFHDDSDVENMNRRIKAPEGVSKSAMKLPKSLKPMNMKFISY
jgi:hypothetical protein